VPTENVRTPSAARTAEDGVVRNQSKDLEAWIVIIKRKGLILSTLTKIVVSSFVIHS
jgi:hypothetical protein